MSVGHGYVTLYTLGDSAGTALSLKSLPSNEAEAESWTGVQTLLFEMHSPQHGVRMERRISLKSRAILGCQYLINQTAYRSTKNARQCTNSTDRGSELHVLCFLLHMAAVELFALASENNDRVASKTRLRLRKIPEARPWVDTQAMSRRNSPSSLVRPDLTRSQARDTNHNKRENGQNPMRAIHGFSRRNARYC